MTKEVIGDVFDTVCVSNVSISGSISVVDIRIYYFKCSSVRRAVVFEFTFLNKLNICSQWKLLPNTDTNKTYSVRLLCFITHDDIILKRMFCALEWLVEFSVLR